MNEYKMSKVNTNKSMFNSKIWCLIIYIQYMTLPLKQVSSRFVILDFLVVGAGIILSLLVNGVSKKFLKYLLIILIVYLIDFLLFRNTTSISFFLIPMIKSSLLMLYCTLSLDKLDDFESVYYKYSLMTLCSVLVYLAIYITTGISATSHMGIGNVLTFIFIAILINQYRFNKRLDFVLLLVIIALTLFFANRMAIISELSCFLFVVNYKKSLNLIVKRVFILIVAVPCFALLISNLDKFFMLISPLIDTNGEMYYSLMKFQRMFTSSDGIFAGLIQSSSGRNLLYDQALLLFKESSFFPRGIAGFYYQDVSGYIFRYPHNIFLEMLTTFGFLAPLVFVMFIAYSSIRISKMKKQQKILTIVFFIFSITKLLASSSFWLAPSFGILIGLLGSNLRESDKV